MPDDPKAAPTPVEEASQAAEPGSETDERRKHPRVPLKLLIQYRFDTFDEFLIEYATDVSIGGMFIRTDDPHEEGSIVYLQFALRDGVKIIEGLGRVVRVNPPGDASRIPGMGIEFVQLDAESKEIIEEIVARNLESPKKAD